MRIADHLVNLINYRLKSECIRFNVDKIIISSFTEDRWIWLVICYNEILSEISNNMILEATVPLYPEEIVCNLKDNVYFHCKHKGVISEIEKNLIDSDLMPRDIRELFLGPPCNSFLLRLVKPDEPLDTNVFRENIYKKTWYGCRRLPTAYNNAGLDIVIGAQRDNIKIRNEESFLHYEVGGSYVSVYKNDLQTQNIYCSIYSSSGNVNYEKISLDNVLSSIGYSSSNIFGYKDKFYLPIEIDVVTKGDGNAKEDIIEGLKTNAHVKHKLKEMIGQKLTEIKEVTVRKIEERITTSRDRKKVLCDGSVVGLEPTCETELIILVSKLEGKMNIIFPSFKILEHTAKDGIDGLINIKRESGIPLEEYATTEYEYLLGNYFEHDHPVEQTKYIICWDTGTLGEGVYYYGNKKISKENIGGGKVEIIRRGWMNILNFGHHMIYVLPVSNMPGINVQHVRITATGL